METRCKKQQRGKVSRSSSVAKFLHLQLRVRFSGSTAIPNHSFRFLDTPMFLHRQQLYLLTQLMFQ